MTPVLFLVPILLGVESPGAVPSVPPLLPKPKELTELQGLFQLGCARVDPGDGPRVRQIAEVLAFEIKDRTGVALELGAGGSIRLRLNPALREGMAGRVRDAILSYQRRPGPPAFPVDDRAAGELADQSYHLVVKTDGVLIEAPDPRGVLHGAMTLVQLARPDGIAAVEIVDWPDMRLRGYHLSVGEPGRDRQGIAPPLYGRSVIGQSILYTPEYLRRIVREVALLKMNAIFFEHDDKVRYASTRPAWHKPSLSIAEVKDWCSWAERYGVKVCPVLNLYARADGLLHAAEFRCYSAGGATPLFTVDVNNPIFRPTLMGIVEEACRVFNGDIIHLGCDEGCRPMGPYWEDSLAYAKAAGLTVVNPLSVHVHRVNNVVKRFGKRLCLSAPRPGEAPGIDRSDRPNTILNDWNYTGGPSPIIARMKGRNAGADLAGFLDGIVSPAIHSDAQSCGLHIGRNPHENIRDHCEGAIRQSALGVNATVRVKYPGPPHEALWEGIAYTAWRTWSHTLGPGEDEFARAFSCQFYGADSPDLAAVWEKLYRCDLPGRSQYWPGITGSAWPAATGRRGDTFYDAERTGEVRDLVRQARELLPAPDVSRHGESLRFLAFICDLYEGYADKSDFARTRDRALGERIIRESTRYKHDLWDAWGHGMWAEQPIRDWVNVLAQQENDVRKSLR